MPTNTGNDESAYDGWTECLWSRIKTREEIDKAAYSGKRRNRFKEEMRRDWIYHRAMRDALASGNIGTFDALDYYHRRLNEDD